MEGLFHRLSGTVQFEIQGDPARFLNVAVKSGVGMWGFARRGETATACCKPKDYKRLWKVHRRCRGKLGIIRKSGLPFLLNRFWKRKGLVLGGVAACAIFWLLSGFVWGVRVTGDVELTPRQILLAAQEQGIYEGAPKKDIQSKAAARNILGSVPDLSWASVNTDGCFVEIAVKESYKKPEAKTGTGISNIIAQREGRILSVEAEHGKPQVAVGDVVEKGQLLIAGIFRETPDPYGPQPEHPYEERGEARGRVLAETYREFTVQVSTQKEVWVSTGEKREDWSLTLFGLTLPLGFHTTPQGNFRSYTRNHQLAALDTSLPVSLRRRIYEETTLVTHELTQVQAQEQALLKLREAQKALLPQGSIILQEELSYSFADGFCILSAKCRCKEEIGLVAEIPVN